MINSTVDLLPKNSTNRKLVKSVFRQESGHEEAIYRRADHRILKEAQAGVAVKELCRKHGFSDAAFYGWRAKYGGMQVEGSGATADAG
jgi:putative transposase